jgi:hypothetical protein
MTRNSAPAITLKDGTRYLILREALFWDIDRANIDLKKNKHLIIERVFSRGNMEEYTQLLYREIRTQESHACT